MKRRDFLRDTAVAGIAGLAMAGCSSVRKTARSSTGPGFDLHPFINAHPEAVFIRRTTVESKRDEQGIRDEAYRLAHEIFVPTESGGYPASTRITCKPNWTCNTLADGKPVFDYRGINTDMFFIEGFLNGVRSYGPQEIFLRECACPDQWEAHGWPRMAASNGFDFRDLTSKDYWELKKGRDLRFVKVPDGVVFKEIAFMAPVTEPDTFLINIAKFKAHGMGLSACIKNVQGVTAKKFHQFCGGSTSIFKSYDKRYHKFFHEDYIERCSELQAKHIADGIPRWDRPEPGGGFWMEQWSQRMLDSYSVTPIGINIVEGIYGRDGNGFASGPHDGQAMDFMSNTVIFGIDAFRVDILSHWLAGHEPGNFGLFHIGIERGFSDVLDPFDIPVYLWDDGRAILARLDSFKRTPLVTYYLARDYNGQAEPQYHLVNEPFDYSAWKSAATSVASKPSIRAIGRDAKGHVNFEVSVPERTDAYVDVLNRYGEVVWRMYADGLMPGVHQVVWDGFSSPGLYSVYVRGMGWDAERQMVVYS